VKCYNDNLSVRLRIPNFNIIFSEFTSSIHNLATKHFWHHARDDNLVRVMLRNANTGASACSARRTWGIQQREERKLSSSGVQRNTDEALPVATSVVRLGMASTGILRQPGLLRTPQRRKGVKGGDLGHSAAMLIGSDRRHGGLRGQGPRGQHGGSSFEQWRAP
jgi:hypothetical protein